MYTIYKYIHTYKLFIAQFVSATRSFVSNRDLFAHMYPLQGVRAYKPCCLLPFGYMHICKNGNFQSYKRARRGSYMWCAFRPAG